MGLIALLNNKQDRGLYCLLGVLILAGIGICAALCWLLYDGNTRDESLVPPGYVIQEKDGIYRWVGNSWTSGTDCSFNMVARSARRDYVIRYEWQNIVTGKTDKVEE